MSLTALEFATIIGGLCGFLALSLTLLQWFLFVRKERPKVKLALPADWERHIRCHPSFLRVPVLFTNLRQTALTITDIDGVVKVHGSRFPCFLTKSSILATTSGEPEIDDIIIEDRPFIQIEPYGCKSIRLILQPYHGARLPLGEGKVYIKCKSVPIKRTWRPLAIPIRILIGESYDEESRFSQS